MTHEELEKKYEQIPTEIKNLRRWVGYKIELRDGRETKVPYNAVTNTYAKSNDPETWTSFRIAIMGLEKYNFAGIGFMLGEGIFGIDLDNHADPVTGDKMNKDEFFALTTEFVNGLNSYSEYSHSGEGVHIICKGNLPVGARRKAGCPVEMYEKSRFFTMTGNVINATSINERTEEIKPLWEKYLNINNGNVPVIINNHSGNGITFGENVVNARNNYAETRYFTDSELLDKIRSSRYGADFLSLYNGDMSAYGNDHSAADLALCKILAFWTNCNAMQIDRIFRGSSLIREKWDQKRNATTRQGIVLSTGTYGSQTIEYAIATQVETYTPPKEQPIVNKPIAKGTIDKTTDVVEFDERNDPIIAIKNIFNTHYFLNDTGNAERFYDYFGENFKYNKDNKGFMFWDGRTWIPDTKDNIRKYANRLLDVLYAEIKQTGKEYEEATQSGDTERAKELKEIGKAQLENYKKVSNKGGKDAMLNELESLHDIPVKNEEFDTQELLLNTLSGVVNLVTGEISAPDKRLKLSKNTNCKVSYEDPVVWLKFLHDIFKRDNPAETEEIINTVQMLLGESLTGRKNKERLVIMHGSGSNGKSTFIRVVNDTFGDYGGTMNSDLLTQNPNSSAQSNEFALASLLGKRIVTTSETAEGKKMDEVVIKKMLSGEKITAQYKYGQQFDFFPTHSPWMSTNNKPIIRATDFGTWRRIFFIPFLNTFTKETKDVEMPNKLLAEQPQILGWMIQGCVKLYNQYHNEVPQPKCLEEALADYKAEFDTIRAFINARCIDFPGMTVEAARLYRLYKEWAKDNGEWTYRESNFRIEMTKKGYKLKKDPNRGGWLYCDLKLASDKGGLIFGEEDDDA